MTLRKLLWAMVVVLAIASPFGVYWVLWADHPVSFTQPQAQKFADDKLPMTTKNNVTVRSAQIQMKEGAFNVQLTAAATPFKRQYAVTATITANPIYDPHAEAFYLDLKTVHVDRFVADDPRGPGLIGKLLERATDPEVDEKGRVLSGIDTALQKAVRIAAVEYLDHRPIYKLPDTKMGNAARYTLSSVDMHEGYVVAHLSLKRVTMAIIAGVMALLLVGGLVALLIACPELGLVIALLPPW